MNTNEQASVQSNADPRSGLFNSPVGRLLLVALAVGLVYSYYEGKQREAERSPEEKAARAKAVAAYEAEKAIENLSSSHKKLIESARRLVANHMLSGKGDGYCERLTDIRLDKLRAGTAVYQYGRREPAISGSYSAYCEYHINGERSNPRQTYWFNFTLQESSSQIEGNILMDNPQRIEQGLQQIRFQAQTL